MASFANKNETVTATQIIFLTTLDPVLSIGGKSEFFPEFVALLVCDEAYQLIGLPCRHGGKSACCSKIFEFPVERRCSVNKAHLRFIVTPGTRHLSIPSVSFFPDSAGCNCLPVCLATFAARYRLLPMPWLTLSEPYQV